jgi:hypothetical protein
MQKQGGAAIHMLPQSNQVSYLVGNPNTPLDSRGLPPFNELVCEYLNELSSRLLKDREAKQFSEVIAFAFWCRKANIARLKNGFAEKHQRLGLGLVFHITPSNVPVNFAFSFACSILAGNANIVRVPSKPFEQIDIICNVIRALFEITHFKPISDMTAFVRYNKDDALTGLISSSCNARVIWGGDETIRQIKLLPLPVRSREISFSDRYSFSAISAIQIVQANKEQLRKLVIGFYNDTYFMDQAACSSPRLVVWIGNAADIAAAKDLFWGELLEEVKEKYELASVNAVDKFIHLCRDAIHQEDINSIKRYGNYIYCIGLNGISDKMDVLQGKFGYFYEFDTDDINAIAHIINSKYQTLTYYGIERQVLLDFIIDNRVSGIDRIVPIGSALDFSEIWDGYDLIRTLSRIIEIR